MGGGWGGVSNRIEAMEAAGVKEGLSVEEARKLAIQTVIGAGVLARESLPITPAELRARVTSPAGTTYAALTHLHQHNWPSITCDAVIAASSRSKELSKL